MKTILVATDFSKEATNAAVYAANFATATGAKIILFHLYHVSIHALNARIYSSSMNELSELAYKQLVKTANQLSEEFSIEVQAVLKEGDFIKELQDTIVATQTDIVVMGMGKDSIEQDIFGNTTTDVLQTLKFPVLAVPVNAVYKGLNTILFACDITRGVHKKVIEKVKDIAVKLDATIELFHVTKTIKQLEQQTNDECDDFADGLDGTKYFYKNVASNAIIKAIQDEVNQINADLLIMVPYKYGFWDAMVHRSKTGMMASRSEIPLLSLPL